LQPCTDNATRLARYNLAA